ncbi:MAG: hypothetical protein AB1716_09515 [Planctomycetota bacterium]
MWSAAFLARADNEITVWQTTGTYVINPTQRTLELTSAGTFKVQATGQYAGLGRIVSISVAQGVTGEINLYVMRDPAQGGGAGANCIGEINLKAPNLVGNIAYLHVCQYLGELANEPIDPNATRATALTGLFKEAVVSAGGLKRDLYLQRLPASGRIGELDHPLNTFASLFVQDPNAANEGQIHLRLEETGIPSVMIAGSMAGESRLWIYEYC